MDLHEHTRHGLTIVGVALDAIPDEHNETQHSDLIPGGDDEPAAGWGGHGHHGDHAGHDHHHGPTLKFDDISRRIKDRVASHGYQFPVTLDITGDFTIALQAGEVPCFALVDARHRLVRRFTRGRSAASILAMLGGSEAASPPLSPPAESQ